MAKNNDKIELKDVLLWIMENSENIKSMDQISTASFPYSTKYQKMYNRPEY